MDREPRQRTAALPFILITLFIDILGIGVIVPVLPELVKQLLEAEEIVAADPISGEILELDASQSEVGEDEKYALAGRYVGVIAASYAFMQFIFAPIMGGLPIVLEEGPSSSSHYLV